MTSMEPHQVLELRLRALEARIEELKRKIARAKGSEKIEKFGDVAELESRHGKLADRLRQLEREGPGFRQEVKAELEAMADDLSGTVEDFMMRLDSDYADEAQTKRPKS